MLLVSLALCVAIVLGATTSVAMGHPNDGGLSSDDAASSDGLYKIRGSVRSVNPNGVTAAGEVSVCVFWLSVRSMVLLCRVLVRMHMPLHFSFAS